MPTLELNMFRGRVPRAYPYYMAGMINDAIRKRKRIRIPRGGKMIQVEVERRLHRENLLAVYGDTHDHAGEGKYINQLAIQEGHAIGPHNVCPYLAEDKTYATIVAAFMSQFHKSKLRGMKAEIRRSREDGIHLHWLGARNQCDSVLLSPLLTIQQLWKIAIKINPDLKEHLQKTKSHIKEVSAHGQPITKFEADINVMRRSRSTFHMDTGEVRHGGGLTPYAMPMEQCEFAIDALYQTTDVKNGEESGQYFYRLAIGRKIPWLLSYNGWKGLDATFKDAYISKEVWQKAQRKSA